MVYYFAYGSNLSQEQMKKRCPESRLVKKAVLRGYRLDFTAYSSGRWKCGVADIVPDSNNEVWGLIYYLTNKDRNNLDSYEGHPTFYKRVKKIIFDENKKEVEVETYEVVNKKSFTPSEEYLNIIKDAAEKFDFPESYIKFLKNIETLDNKEYKNKADLSE